MASPHKFQPSPVPSPSVESGEKGGPSQEDNALAYTASLDFPQVDERKLLRKIDLHLIPWLSLLYLLSFLDRTSIGNAKLYGLEKSLHMTDKQYLIALTIFFFPYALFEVPSNIFLKRLRPSLWLSGLMLLWGVMMTVQGLVHNYGGLLGMRWMLGMMEAGLFPGVTYYLSCWYKRSEFGIRAAIFFSAASVSGAFGGLLAAAISNMDGVGGKPAWAWIFILEGLATIMAGLASFFIIQDFPDTARFLSEAERTVVIRRLQSDDQFSAAGENLKWRNIKSSFTDWKTWMGIGIYVGADMPLYAFSLFLPSIINKVCAFLAVGFRATPANLLTVPVYASACVVTCFVGFLADKYKQRGVFNLYDLPRLQGLAAIGYIILITSKTPALSYVAVYLAACGIYPLIRKAWVSNNVEGSYKRSVSLALVISLGNINGAVSSNVYRARDAPRYHLGHGLVLMYIGLGIITTMVYYVLLRRENAARDHGERDEVIDGVYKEKESLEDREERARRNGRFASIEEAKQEKGDQWSGYRYIL
ncbi:MFS general substrate transporter [Multifurca ochricompacta]|uniref:MFS general substrate transporter n=1 Tax=Multifurca ochricompacta TaxID=376703 RepID=A0AAD4M8M8_9AGAM|nr:MFS general substrate transporter [Multifurca ochricompacta]